MFLLTTISSTEFPKFAFKRVTDHMLYQSWSNHYQVHNNEHAINEVPVCVGHDDVKFSISRSSSSLCSLCSLCSPGAHGEVHQGPDGVRRQLLLSWSRKSMSCSAELNTVTFQVGRVKIQVYRGPSKGEGYDVFAPWGYYNTQPADLAVHH